MKKTFQIGQRVAVFMDEDNETITAKVRYDEYGDNGPFYGKIVELNGVRAKVLFEEEWLNETITTHNSRNNTTQEQVSPATVATRLLWGEEAVKEIVSELELQFKTVEKQVKAKLKMAAKEIREAQKLAKTVHADLADMDVSALYSAMDAAGWRSSSFDC